MEEQIKKFPKSQKIFEKYELIYKVDNTKDYLRLLGNNFFKRNKGLGNFIYKRRKIPLIEKIETSKIKMEFLEINLIFY